MPQAFSDTPEFSYLSVHIILSLKGCKEPELEVRQFALPDGSERREPWEIAIQFHSVPHQSFPPEASLAWQPSKLVITIQPEEGIVLGFQAKYPGPKMQLRPVDMRFNYRESFAAPSPDAYETLLWDVMKNDATLFMRADQVEAAWQLLMPVLDVWAVAPPNDFPNYAAGTWGPEETQGLLAYGHNWPLPMELERPCENKESANRAGSAKEKVR